MKITFLGAAREVTGSCYLVETDAVCFLVDCGLFQGGKEAGQKNRRALDFDVRHLDFVLLTHAHLDHSGLLPRLIAFGYAGPVFCSAATADLVAVLLADAALLEESASESPRQNGRRLEPLYTLKQATAASGRLRRVHYDEPIQPHQRVHCVFRDAGHILGSSILEVFVDDRRTCRKLVFTGDIGQPGHPIVEDPTPVDRADVLVIESTYGDRAHKPMPDSVTEFAQAITDTIERKGGNVIIPSFAVGRTQDLLYLITRLSREGRLPPLNVYVDSPMATAATAITLRHLDIADADTVSAMRWSREHHQRPRIRFVESQRESRTLSEVEHGALIIAASGMCDAGRVRQHLLTNLPNASCSVVFTGFQAAGTLGRQIVDGSTTVSIDGVAVPVRADIYTIGGLSAHADRDALLEWLAHFSRAPEHTFVVHGEAAVALSFAEAVRGRFGWQVKVPTTKQCFTI